MEKTVVDAKMTPTESRAVVRCVKKKKRKKDLELLRRQVLKAKRNLRKEAAPSKVRKTSLSRALNYFADQRQENDKKTRGVDSEGKRVGKRKICTKLLPSNEQRIGIFAKGSKGDRIKRENQHLNEETRARLRGDIHKLMNGNNSNSISPANFSSSNPPAKVNGSPILGNINRPKRYRHDDDLPTKKHTKKSEIQNLNHADLLTAESPPSPRQKENRYKRRLFVDDVDDVDDNFGKMDRFLTEELRFSPNITPDGISTMKVTPERNSSDREIINESENTKMPFLALKDANWSPTRRYERLCSMICSEKFENCLEQIQYTDPLQKARRTLMGIYADSCRQHLLRQRSNANKGLENSTTSSSMSESEDQVDVTEDTGVLSSTDDSDDFLDPQRKHGRRDGKENQTRIAEAGNVDISNERRRVKSSKREARRIFEQDSHKDDDELPTASLRVNIDLKNWNSADRLKSDIIPVENIAEAVEREAFMIKFHESMNMNKAKKDTLRSSPQEACWSSSPQTGKSLKQSLDDPIRSQKDIVEFLKDPVLLKLGNFEDSPGDIYFRRSTKYVPAILRRSNSRKSTGQANISDPLFPLRLNTEKATEIVSRDKNSLKMNANRTEAESSFAIPKMDDQILNKLTTDISFSVFETRQQTPSIVNAHLEQKNRLMKSKVNFMNAKYRTISRGISEESERHGYSRNEERDCLQRTKCDFDSTTTKASLLQQSSKEAAPVPARNTNISTFQEKYLREFIPHREENGTQGESHKKCAKNVKILWHESNDLAEGCAIRQRDQRDAMELARNELQNCKASNWKRRDARDFAHFPEAVDESSIGGAKITNNQKQPIGFEILRNEDGGNQLHNYVSRNAATTGERQLQNLVPTSSFDNEDSRNLSNFHPCNTSEGLLGVIAFENQSDTCAPDKFVQRTEQQAANSFEDGHVQPAKYLAYHNSQGTRRIPIYIRNENVGLASESSSGNFVNFTKNQQGKHKMVVLSRDSENKMVYALDNQAPRSLLKNLPGSAVQNSEVTCLGCPAAAAQNLYGQTATLKESCQSGAHRILQNVQIIEPLFRNKERNHCYPGVVYQEDGRMVASFMAEPIGIKKSMETSGNQFQNARPLQTGQDSQGQSHYSACVYSHEEPNRPKRIQLSDGKVGVILPKNNEQRQHSAANYGVVYTGRNSNFELVVDPLCRQGERTRSQADGSCDHLHKRLVPPVYNIIDAHPSQVSTSYFPTSF